MQQISVLHLIAAIGFIVFCLASAIGIIASTFRRPKNNPVNRISPAEFQKQFSKPTSRLEFTSLKYVNIDGILFERQPNGTYVPVDDAH